MKEIKTVEEFDEAKKGKKVLVVDFYTTWCGPCKMVTPVLEEISKEMEEQGKDVEICKVDCDALASIADDYEIASIPTIVLFNKGNKLDGKLVGAKSKDKYIEEIEKALKLEVTAETEA